MSYFVQIFDQVVSQLNAASLSSIISSLLTYICYMTLISSVIFGVMVCVFCWYKNLVCVKMCPSKKNLTQKTVIITGPTSGLGEATALDMARRGAKVILACRNLTKGQEVADKIRKLTGNPKQEVHFLDLANMESVRVFAEKILTSEPIIDILILNAGIVGPKYREQTTEGLEVTMATNHFGHFLLLNLLIGRMKETPGSRVVIVTSSIHHSLKNINIHDLNFSGKNKYGCFSSYAASKFCNVMTTRYMAAITKGSGVLVNCVCPGIVSTKLLNKKPDQGFYFKYILPMLTLLFGRTPEKGAQVIIHAAVCDEVQDVTGAFFVDNDIAKINNLIDDPGLLNKFWEKSEQIVKLKNKERTYRVPNLKPEQETSW